MADRATQEYCSQWWADYKARDRGVPAAVALCSIFTMSINSSCIAASISDASEAQLSRNQQVAGLLLKQVIHEATAAVVTDAALRVLMLPGDALSHENRRVARVAAELLAMVLKLEKLCAVASPYQLQHTPHVLSAVAALPPSPSARQLEAWSCVVAMLADDGAGDVLLDPSSIVSQTLRKGLFPVLVDLLKLAATCGAVSPATFENTFAAVRHVLAHDVDLLMPDSIFESFDECDGSLVVSGVSPLRNRAEDSAVERVVQDIACVRLAALRSAACILAHGQSEHLLHVVPFIECLTSLVSRSSAGLENGDGGGEVVLCSPSGLVEFVVAILRSGSVSARIAACDLLTTALYGPDAEGYEAVLAGSSRVLLEPLVRALVACNELDAYDEISLSNSDRYAPDRVEDVFVALQRSNETSHGTEPPEGDAEPGGRDELGTSSLRSAVATCCAALALAVPEYLRDVAIPVVMCVISSSTSTTWAQAEAAVAFAGELIDEVPPSQATQDIMLVACNFLRQAQAHLAASPMERRGHTFERLEGCPPLRSACVTLVEHALRSSSLLDAGNPHDLASVESVLSLLWSTGLSDGNKKVASTAVNATVRLAVRILSDDNEEGDEMGDRRTDGIVSCPRMVLGMNVAESIVAFALPRGASSPSCEPLSIRSEYLRHLPMLVSSVLVAPACSFNVARLLCLAADEGGMLHPPPISSCSSWQEMLLVATTWCELLEKLADAEQQRETSSEEVQLAVKLWMQYTELCRSWDGSATAIMGDDVVAAYLDCLSSCCDLCKSTHSPDVPSGGLFALDVDSSRRTLNFCVDALRAGAARDSSLRRAAVALLADFVTSGGVTLLGVDSILFVLAVCLDVLTATTNNYSIDGDVTHAGEIDVASNAAFTICAILGVPNATVAPPADIHRLVALVAKLALGPAEGGMLVSSSTFKVNALLLTCRVGRLWPSEFLQELVSTSSEGILKFFQTTAKCVPLVDDDDEALSLSRDLLDLVSAVGANVPQYVGSSSLSDLSTAVCKMGISMSGKLEGLPPNNQHCGLEAARLSSGWGALLGSVYPHVPRGALTAKQVKMVQRLSSS